MKLRSLLTSFRRPALVLGVLLAMTLLVLWLSGTFGAKIPATREPARVARVLPDGVPTWRVAAVEVPIVEEALGTVRAVQEVAVSSRLLARVVALHVTAAGQRVDEGELLVELESADLRARLSEAEAAHRSAQETLQQAGRDLVRTTELHAQKIASDLDLERDTSRVANAQAEVDRAEQAALAAESTLGYAKIRAPSGGIVIDKLVESGNTVEPGQVLMKLYDPTRMQLVASVREQLATRLRIGGEVEVAIDALDLRCAGTVGEIVPQAAAGSRAFDVKVVGPCPEGVFTGMFGRLFVPLGTRDEIHVPDSAVRSFGQVDQVYVVRADSTLLRRFVVLERSRDGERTVLAGLSPGEIIVTDESRLRAAEGR